MIDLKLPRLGGGAKEAVGGEGAELTVWREAADDEIGNAILGAAEAHLQRVRAVGNGRTYVARFDVALPVEPGRHAGAQAERGGAVRLQSKAALAVSRFHQPTPPDGGEW